MATRERLLVTADRLQAIRGDIQALISPVGLLSNEYHRGAARSYLFTAALLMDQTVANILADLAAQSPSLTPTLRATLIGCLRAVKASLSDGVSDSFIADFGVSEVAGCVAHLRDEADQQRTRAEAAEAELRELKRFGHCGGIK